MAIDLLTLSEVADLRALVARASVQELDTAEIKRASDDEWLECPFCGGEGSTDGATYTNYDGHAIGVQFFGVGDQFVANEEAYRAIWKAIPKLLLAAEAIAMQLAPSQGASD